MTSGLAVVDLIGKLRHRDGPEPGRADEGRRDREGDRLDLGLRPRWSPRSYSRPAPRRASARPSSCCSCPTCWHGSREIPLAEVVVVSGAYADRGVAGAPAPRRARRRLPRLGARPRRKPALRARDASAPRSTRRSSCSPTAPSSIPRAVERVLARRGEAPLVAASYDGVRGHPVADRARALGGDRPTTAAASSPCLLVACDDLTPPGDIDTPDLARRAT